jgi:hypothetical protein
VRIAMVLFQFLEVVYLFGDYLRVKYLCHAFIMPSTKRNGITKRGPCSQCGRSLVFYSPEFAERLSEEGH